MIRNRSAGSMEPEPVVLMMTALVLLLTGVEQTSSSWLGINIKPITPINPLYPGIP